MFTPSPKKQINLKTCHLVIYILNSVKRNSYAMESRITWKKHEEHIK